MKKNIKRIIATIVFLSIGVYLFKTVSYALRPTEYTFRRDDVTGLYGEKEDSLDVVIIGSSAVFRYINSMTLWEEYGMTSYNLTTPGQSCFIVEYLIDEVLKEQKPDVLVVETRKFIRMDNKEELPHRWPLIVNNMNYSWNRVKLINYLYDDWEDRMNNYFDILQYHNNWEILTSENLEYADNKIMHWYHGAETIGEVKKMKEPTIYTDIEPSPISKEVEEALVSLLEKCDEEGIEVLFTATPWIIDEKYQKKNLYIKNIIEEKGYKFLDMNQYYEEIGLDFAVDYYDTNHTNTVGAEKVSKFFGQYLLDNYDMNLEHGEDIKIEWDAACEAYNAEAEPIREKIAELSK